MAYTFGQRAGVAIYPAGVQAFIHTGRGRHPDAGGPRGEIKGFSGGSRRRMRGRLLAFDWPRMIKERRVVWVTFTAREGTAKDFKKWLSAWRHRFHKRNSQWAWFIWRLEYQVRGVAHLHLIVVYPQWFTAQGVNGDLRRCVLDWCELAGSTSDALPNALSVGQKVRLVKGVYGIASYISDASKAAQACPPADEHPGRWWGVRGFHDFDDVLPVIVYGHHLISDFRRFVRSLRRGRYRVFGRRVKGRYRVRDCIEFFDTDCLFRVRGVFCDEALLDE